MIGKIWKMKLLQGRLSKNFHQCQHPQCTQRGNHMKRLVQISFTIAILSAVGNPDFAAARTFYVAPNGADDHPGTRKTRPQGRQVDIGAHEFGLGDVSITAIVECLGWTK